MPLLYPPGPDGVTAAELATRIGRDPVIVRRLLEELEELGYVESHDQQGFSERRMWLTIEGDELVVMAEDELLATSAVTRRTDGKEHETNRARA